MLALRYTSFLAVVIAAGSVLAEEPRMWTDTSGRKVEATFIRVFNGNVILERDGRALPHVPLSRFSASDQQYIRDVTSGKKPASEAADPKPDMTPAAGAPGDKAAASRDAKAAEKVRSDNLKAKVAAAELRRVREWSDSGNTFRGRFERFFGQQAVVMQGNKARKINFSDLGAADQEFLRRNFEAQGRSAEVPTAIASARSAEGNNNNAAAQNALAAGFGEMARALVGGAGSASSAGPSGGFPAPPNFGGLSEQMRQQQDQARKGQEEFQRRFEEFQKRSDEARAKFEAARSRTPRSQSPQTPQANVASAAPSGGYGAPNSSPAIPAATPPKTRPSGFAGAGATPNPHASASPFSQPAAAEQPNALPASPLGNLPNLFAGSPSAQPQPQLQQVEVIQCGKCGKQQRPGFKAGQKCQHCGTTIDIITDESGKVVDKSVRATGKSIKFWVTVVIAAIAVIGGVITKLKAG